MEHDLRLVVLAALICATACLAAFGFHHRSSLTAASTMRWAWMALTGVVAGSGVWATHFVAMLAYQPHLPIGYDTVITVVSLLMAMVGMGFGFAIPLLQPGRFTPMLGGAVTGVSVAVMHFTGIEAMRTQAQFHWDDRFVVASILVGAIGAAAAFQARARLSGRAGWAASAVLLLLAIVGMHFTAMTAVQLIPDPTLAVPAELIGRGALAMATVALAAMILAAAFGLMWMERLGRSSTMTDVRDALDVVSSGLAFYDPNGVLVSWNRAHADLLRGSGVELAQGMSRDVQSEQARAAGWTAHGGTESAGMDIQRPDGRWLRFESFVTQDGGGVTVLTDITQQRETARILGEARDAAEAANRAKSQFLANMSHEIRTPLNGVLGVADVLSTTELSPKQQDLVGVIRTSGALLNSLLNDLLDLARIEAGVAVLRPERTSLGELVGSVGDLFAPRAEQKGVLLKVEIGAGAGAEVECDPIRLRQVLGNLVSNAIKFTDDGEVVVRLARQGDHIDFQVRDTGVGFSEATKATLFGRFQQGDDSSTRKYGGAGLGLAICRDYVSLMGGELDCASQPGVGSVFGFQLTLPVMIEAPKPAAVVVDFDPAPAAGGRFRVLVVDDNAINRQVMGLILEAAGIEHAGAEDGCQGLEAACTGDFDAVLMDIQMPVMDGFESTRLIRDWESRTGRARMPIYIVSANCLQEHVDAGLAAGADGHLSKPVSVPALLGALEPHATASHAAA